MLDILVEAAIKMESPSGLNERPRWFFGGNRFSGIGPAKVSDAEMEGDYGIPVDDDHDKAGLGLRNGSCDRWRGCTVDQDDLDIAILAMNTRIAMRLDICVKNGCSSTDMVMVALLAADERILPKTLKGAFTDYKLENETTILNWQNFLLDNWDPGPNGQHKNKQLINRFSGNAQESLSQDFPEIDWDYINGLGQWQFSDFLPI